MSRRSMEFELLELRFKQFTASVRETISTVVKEHRCSDTSDTVIEALWEEYSTELSAALRQRKILTLAAQREQNGRDLSTPTREAVRSWINEALEYEAELGDLDDDAFEVYYLETMRPIVRDKRARRARRAGENDRWEFFSAVEADADFERWRDKPLSPAQVVALSLGKEPDVVTPERLKPYRTPGGSPFREKFKDRLDLVEAAIAAGTLSLPLSITVFSDWATSVGWEITPEFPKGKNQTFSEEAAHWKSSCEKAQADLEALRQSVDDMPPKSRASIYRMVLGMAIAKYKHVTGPRSKATNAIRDDLRLHDLNLGSEAIHDHLNAAADLLDFTWPKPGE